MNPARVAYHIDLIRRKRQLERELSQVNTALAVSENEMVDRMMEDDSRRLRNGSGLLYMQREVVAHIHHGDDGNTDQAQRALRASRLERVLKTQIDINKLKDVGRKLLRDGKRLPEPAAQFINIEEVLRLRFRDSEEG